MKYLTMTTKPTWTYKVWKIDNKLNKKQKCLITTTNITKALKILRGERQ